MALINKRFAYPFEDLVDHRERMKESKKIDKYLWNVKVKVMPRVIEALETIPKDQEKSLEEVEIIKWIENIYTTVLLELSRIFKRVLYS